MYVFASTPRAVAMAELVAPDIIKLDQGEKGTVENEMVRDGVPAITLELGKPEVFDARDGRPRRSRPYQPDARNGDAGPGRWRHAPRSTFIGNKQEVARASPRAALRTCWSVWAQR
jgi:hypothetical protein